LRSTSPDLAANSWRFSCDELILETTKDKWKQDMAELQAAVNELPALKDVVRIGAFHLISLPFTQEMRKKVDDANALRANMREASIPPEEPHQEKASFGYDFTWDPLLVLMFQQDKNLAESQLKPPDAFFVWIIFSLSCCSQYHQVRENLSEVKLEFKHVPLSVRFLASLAYFDNKQDAFNLEFYINKR
jgi:hypothetical protein